MTEPDDLTDALSRGPLEAPGAGVLRRLDLAFRRRVARRADRASVFVTFARLVADSWRDPAPAGVRRVHASDRLLTFEAEGLTVEAVWRPMPEGEPGRLSGSIAGGREPAVGWIVEVVPSGEEPREDVTDDAGFFLLEDLPADVTSVLLIQDPRGGRVYRLPDLDPAPGVE